MLLWTLSVGNGAGVVISGVGGSDDLGPRQVVDVQRADQQPVRGEIRVRTPSETRTIPFTLSDERVVVGRVDIVTRWVVR